MTAMRRLLPKSWFRDIDYDRRANVDWRDDFDPSEPRNPAGQAGGGQWTSGGGGGAPALTKYAGRAGAKYKALVEQHLEAGLAANETPQQLAEKIKGAASKFKSSNVAGYLNQLISHLEKGHGLAPGTLGKAVKGAGTPAEAAAPPTDEEIAKWAQSVEAEPPVTTAAPLAAPPGDHHPAIADMEKIAGNAWPDAEKLSWIQALSAEIPPEDTEGANYAKGLIAKLGAPDASAPVGTIAPAVAPPEALPPAVLQTQKGVEAIYNDPTLSKEDKIAKISGKLEYVSHPPNVAYAKQAIALLESEKAAAATLPPPNRADSDELLAKLPAPHPFSPVQGEAWGVASDPMISTEAKIDQIKVLVGSAWKPEDQTYGATLIKALKSAGTTAPPAAPAAPIIPQPNSSFTQEQTYSYATDPKLSMEEKVKKIEGEIWMAGPVGQAYGKLVLASLAQQTPEPEATPAQGAAPDMDTPHTAEQAEALKKSLPTPEANMKQTAMWEIASTAGISPNEKIAGLKEDIEAASFASNKEYGQSLIEALGGEKAAAPTEGDLDKLPTPNEVDALEKGLPTPGGPKNEQDLWETAALPDWTAAQKIKQLEADMTTGGIAEDGPPGGPKAQAHAYAKSLIAYLKSSPLPTAPTESPKPDATGGIPPVPENLKNNFQAGKIIGQATNGMNSAQQMDDWINAQVSAGTFMEGVSTHAYGKAVVAAMKAKEAGGAAGGATATDPTAIPGLPGQYGMIPFLKKFHEYATNGMNSASIMKQEMLAHVGANVIGGGEAHEWMKSVVAAMEAKEAAKGGGGAAPGATGATAGATPPSVPPPSVPPPSVPMNLPLSAFTHPSKYISPKTGKPINSAAATAAYKIAAGYGTSAEKAAKINNLITQTGAAKSSFWKSPGYKYVTGILKQLNQHAAALSAATASTASTAGPAEKPQPPPANLPTPAAGSNTQSAMHTIASDNPTGPGGKTNTQKIEAIEEALANSGGSDGGKAETYANQLITALGGQATTATAAKAKKAAKAPPPAWGGNTSSAPAAPKPKKLSTTSEVDPAKYPAWTKAMPKPTPDELDAVESYTGSYYKPINNALRAGIGVTPKLAKWSKDLHTFLGRASFPEDAVLTRKLSGEYANQLLSSSNLVKGNIFIDNGFVSTDHWSGELTVKINIKKGAKAAYVKSISSNKPEQEIIVQKGSQFRITSYDAAQKHITVDLLNEDDPAYIP